MLKTRTKIIRLAAADYIRDYCDPEKFREYCKVCENYGTVWVCPPYRFDTVARIKAYRYVYIIGTQVFVDEITRHMPANATEQKEISYRIMEEGRKELDGPLLELEGKYPGSLAFFAGSCYLCRKEDCARRKGEECIHPDKARSSLEAYGFDIAATSEKLLGIGMKWSENLVLPEYFTWVSGFFTDHDIDGWDETKSEEGGI